MPRSLRLADRDPTLSSSDPTTPSIAVVGAGAAGLMAAIWAGRTAEERNSRISIAAFDGALKLGAKILVAGGGRCNVTHHEVDEHQYAGSSRNAIKKVLRRFDVAETVLFFKDLGVELKREDTGKLFPVTDTASTVLHALLDEARRAGTKLIHPERVQSIARADRGFDVITAGQTRRVDRVILATGGRALPKTGSDGGGYELAKALGHTITPHTFPALAPLLLDPTCFLLALSGITLPATIELLSPTGKRLQSFTNSLLLAHFGLSGPGVLDISRYFTAALLEHGDKPAPGPTLALNFLPTHTTESFDLLLQGIGNRGVANYLSSLLPDRLARALAEHCAIDPAAPGHTLTREQRRRLAAACTRLTIPATATRGYTYAEATAGGVPLSELHLDTMESRVCPGLHLCGEILDVDGRVGGFNFQWAWASGFVAGTSAARALIPALDAPTLPP
ncbi:MAG: NAD(P)/FAD-dependent oxidoreductase [Phycisphaerales bacterium]